MNVLREGRKDEILELDGVVGQRVDKVEMEVTQELRVVLENDEDHIHGRGVETTHGGRGLLSWNEVEFDEGEAAHEQVLHLVKSLELVLNLIQIVLL